MINNKYTSLNVLSNEQMEKLKNLSNTREDSINQIAAMINTSSNRAQKRKIEKTLRKVEKIQAKCENVVNKKNEKKLAVEMDKSFMYIMGVVGLTLMEDYRWKEDPDQDHGQITAFFERVTKRMSKYADSGYSTQDILIKLEEMSGIQLVSSYENN